MILILSNPKRIDSIPNSASNMLPGSHPEFFVAFRLTSNFAGDQSH